MVSKIRAENLPRSCLTNRGGRKFIFHIIHSNFIDTECMLLTNNLNNFLNHELHFMKTD